MISLYTEKQTITQRSGYTDCLKGAVVTLFCKLIETHLKFHWKSEACNRASRAPSQAMPASPSPPPWPPHSSSSRWSSAHCIHIYTAPDPNTLPEVPCYSSTAPRRSWNRCFRGSSDLELPEFSRRNTRTVFLWQTHKKTMKAQRSSSPSSLCYSQSCGRSECLQTHHHHPPPRPAGPRRPSVPKCPKFWQSCS